MELNNFSIYKFDALDSTNNYASAMVAEGFGHGTVVLAQFQNAGRGQKGNSWESEAGKNMLCSVIVQPNFLHAGEQFYVSKIVSIALAGMLQVVVNEVTIKWPNDIYIGKRKVAGILIENMIKGVHIDYSILGVGLNVNQTSFLSDAPNPVSLCQVSGSTHSVDHLLEQFLWRLDEWYRRLQQGAFDEIDQKYLSLLYRREGWFPFRKGELVFEARITGVGKFGQLLLENRKGKIEEFFFKEVEFVL